MARVYISSTFEDLKEERRRVSDAILSVGHQPAKMEVYAAASRPPQEHCLANVRSFYKYIGVAFRYRCNPSEQKKSITVLERAAARDAGLAQLIFLLDKMAS